MKAALLDHQKKLFREKKEKGMSKNEIFFEMINKETENLLTRNDSLTKLINLLKKN